MTRAKIGMLGAGFVANVYMQSLRFVRDCDVVACFSQRERSRADFAQKWEIPTPHDVHGRIDRESGRRSGHRRRAASRARHRGAEDRRGQGKAVVCTKPLGRSGRRSAPLSGRGRGRRRLARLRRDPGFRSGHGARQRTGRFGRGGQSLLGALPRGPRADPQVRPRPGDQRRRPHARAGLPRRGGGALVPRRQRAGRGLRLGRPAGPRRRRRPRIRPSR